MGTPGVGEAEQAEAVEVVEVTEEVDNQLLRG
jgi:hypothetical protein